MADDKRDLRDRTRAVIGAVTPEQAREWSGAICERLLTLDDLRRVATVLVFLPLAGEVDITSAGAGWAASGKQLCLPRVNWNGPSIDAIAVKSLQGRLRIGRHRLREPAHGAPVPPGALGAVIVPGLAFDEAGRRLGRGGGFYDRFLATTPALRVGVCFEVQLAPRVPTGPLDLPVSIVVTERRVIRPPPVPPAGSRD